MGHKVNPNGFRLGIIKGWDSRWYANRNYKDLFSEDRKLRDVIRKRLHNAAVSKIEIERVAGTQLALTIHTAKPGIVIGRNGESVERLRQDLEKLTKKKVRLNILEIRNPDVDAYLVARSIAEQLEKRVSFRRAMKQSVQKSMRAGAKGIKVVMGGRLGGAEIARTEKEVDGSVPLQTLRANIDYGLAEAHTTFGVIGVKVWIYHGDVLPEKVRKEGPAAVAATVPAGGPGEREGRGERGGRGYGGERGERGERGFGGERGPRGGGGMGGPGGERRPRSGGPGGPGGERGPGGPRPGGPGAGGERRPPRAGGPGGERGPGGPRPGGPGAGGQGGAGRGPVDRERGGERRVSPTAPRVSPSDPAYNELRSADYVGTRKGPGPERVPSEKPTGEIETGVGPSLPSSGPVTPSPAGEPEFPAPQANEQANPVQPAQPLVGSADGTPRQVEPGQSAPESPRGMGDKEGDE